MNILDQLSSRLGDRTEGSNRAAAQICLEQPDRLLDIVTGLGETDEHLVGDCAEVVTLVAQARPELVAPYAGALTTLLDHRFTRARWEAMHALALVAEMVPGLITGLLPTLVTRLRNDRSVIVRDYAVEALGRYARTGRPAAESVYPHLTSALALWGGKHAARALAGLEAVARNAPEHQEAIRGLAYAQLSSGRGVTRQAARKLLRATER